MKSQILLENIELNLNIGVTKEERSEKQIVLVTISFDTDISQAMKSDDIEDTLNYEEIYNKVLDLQANEYKLIERLTGDIQTILEEKKIIKYKTKVTKIPFEKCGDVSIIVASD